MTHAIIAPGRQLQGGRVDRAMLSPGVWIEAEAEVQESILEGHGSQVAHQAQPCAAMESGRWPAAPADPDDPGAEDEAHLSPWWDVGRAGP